MSVLIWTFLTILASAYGSGDWKGGFYAKFPSNILKLGKTGFIPLPQNETQAIADGWIRANLSENCPVPSLRLYIYECFLVSIYYDDNGSVAGHQHAIPKDNITTTPFDLRRLGYSNWTVTTENGTIEFWASSVFFVTNETLANKTRAERLAARTASTTLFPNNYIWLTSFNQTLIQVPLNYTDFMNDGTFTEQAFIIWMGKHFYYQMTENLLCTNDTMFPYFPIWNNQELIAMGNFVIAELDISENCNFAPETPTEDVVKAIVPSGPQCMYDYASKPGIRTTHIYYIDAPWLIFTE